MKIDTDTHMTVAQATKALGMSRRALYRAMDRAEAEGVVVSVSVLSRRLILRDKLDAIKARYFPFGSDRRHEMQVRWGRVGGLKKKANERRRGGGVKTQP